MNALKALAGILVLLVAGWLLLNVFAEPDAVAEVRAFTSSRQPFREHGDSCHGQQHQRSDRDRDERPTSRVHRQHDAANDQKPQNSHRLKQRRRDFFDDHFPHRSPRSNQK